MTDDHATTADTDPMVDSPSTNEAPEATPIEGELVHAVDQFPSDTSDEMATQGTNPQSDDTGLSRRDIRYREQLRATEAERDTLRNTLESMQRREVERVAAEHLVKPSSLWTVGVELDNLLDDDGTVDPEKVRATAIDARQQHGLEDPKASKLRSPVVPREGNGNTKGPTNSWADAFK